MKKINIAIICGGNSSEHDVSKRSAINIYNNLNKNEYNVSIFLMREDGFILGDYETKHVLFGSWTEKKAFTREYDGNPLFNLQELSDAHNVNIFFPIIHGNIGEDGTLQGLFKLINKPYVGSGITGSTLGFDKDLTKQLLILHHIPTAKYILLTPGNYKEYNFNTLENKLGKIIFIKPARQGSSVGVHQVSNQRELNHALKDAFQYDDKILAEQGIKNKKEVEVSVIGNNHPVASPTGAVVVPKSDKFYTYQNKFVDSSKVHFEIPAKVPKDLAKKAQKMAVETFKILNLKGMARIDFLIDKQNNPYVCEANTLPGFTNISLFPQLWKAIGISESKLIDKLVLLAFQEYHHKKQISHKYKPLPK